MTEIRNETTRPNTSRSPVGWLEILAAAAGVLAVGFGVTAILDAAGPDEVTRGVVMSSLAGLVGIGGFALAFGVRVRRLAPFGLVRTTWRWLAVAAAAGAALFLLRGLVLPWVIELLGIDTETQTELVGGSRGGVLALVLTGIGIAIVGPIGEELVFRGVLQTALLRYGAVLSTTVSAVAFALIHADPILMIVALPMGVLTAELYRRSGSIWPAVAAHVVHNAPTPFLYVLLL